MQLSFRSMHPNGTLHALLLLQVLRVARVFRLLKGAAGLRSLLNTLVFSLPSLINVGALLLLMFFVFAVMAMRMFAYTKRGEFLNEHANFYTFFNSLVGGIVCLTLCAY